MRVTEKSERKEYFIKGKKLGSHESNPTWIVFMRAFPKASSDTSRSWGYQGIKLYKQKAKRKGNRNRIAIAIAIEIKQHTLYPSGCRDIPSHSPEYPASLDVCLYLLL